MIEFVFCVPLIALVLGLTFFFGWSMKNQQRVIVSARYTAWKNVLSRTTPTSDNLNETFFGDKADDVSVDLDPGTNDTLIDYAQQAGSQYGAAVETLATELAMERFPNCHRAGLGAEFSSDVGIWSKFTGPITRSHIRDGIEWRRGQALQEQAVADQFYSPFDSALSGIPAPADELAQMFRDLYLQGW